jgi:hypothetical protein
MKQCSECSEPVSGYSKHCNHHKRANRRHGHPLQTGVTVYELAPYLRRVKARIQKNEGSPVWDLLRGRWQVQIQRAQQVTAAHAKGSTYQRYERAALLDVLKLAANVDTDKVMTMALALFLIRSEQPRRFKSDRAFLCQMARRVRGLTEVNAGTSWDHQKQRMKRYYRETPPQALEALGQLVGDVFAVAGMHVAAMEQREMEQKMNEKKALNEALEALV